MAQTHVFAANLKNSVTRFVDPFRVMAWRVGACFVGAMIVVGGTKRERKVSEVVAVLKWRSCGRTRARTRRVAEPLNCTYRVSHVTIPCRPASAGLCSADVPGLMRLRVGQVDIKARVNQQAIVPQITV